LEEIGIKVVPGKVRWSAICPKCNDSRQKHKNVPCLTVNNEPDNQWVPLQSLWLVRVILKHGAVCKGSERSRMPKDIGQVATYSKEVREYLAKRGIDLKIALKHKI